MVVLMANALNVILPVAATGLALIATVKTDLIMNTKEFQIM